MRSRVAAAVAGAACTLLIVCAGRQEDTWTTLLDRDLSQWEMYLSYVHKPGYAGEVPVDDKGAPIPPIGYGRNERNVFSVSEEAGEPVLRISGEVYGCVFTREEFGNYHLKLQVRWGEKKWNPRLNQPMDSGVLYHSQGECGRDYWRSWMLSQELQIMEGSFGDYWSQVTSLMDIKAVKPAGTSSHRYDPAGTLLSFGDGTGNSGYCQRSQDYEKPKGEWNTVELVAFEGKSLHIVNGRVVMALQNSRYRDGALTKPLRRGKIQLQSEAAEVYYKGIEIRPISELPEELAACFR